MPPRIDVLVGVLPVSYASLVPKGVCGTAEPYQQDWHGTLGQQCMAEEVLPSPKNKVFRETRN